MELFQLYPSESRLTVDEQEEADDCLLDLGTKWREENEENDENPGDLQSTQESYWCDLDLHWNTDNSQLEVCKDRLYCERERESHGMFLHISSQLLQYRLTIYMGRAPNLETDGYKTCWEVIFRHSDRCSTLRFWDGKGAARVEFIGLKNSEDDALRLVNFLAGLRFPHTYDRVIAGTIA